MKKIFLLSITLLTLLVGSCDTPKVAYLKDLDNGQIGKVQNVMDIRVKPQDKISIVVKSKNNELAALFNLQMQTSRIGEVGNSNSGTSQGVSVYTVDSNGNIDFPVLGEIAVSGLTREEIAKKIKDRLVSTRNLLDPVVTVEYANLVYNVIGEVNRPGRFTIDKDRVTLLEAISMAGDLTIYGRRDSLTVMREINKGEMVTYKVGLLSGEELYKSPVFYLQQNDLVIVEPSEYKARQATVNANTVRSTSFWISCASLAMSVVILLTNL